MPLPPDLPSRFSAEVCGIVHALIAHSILRGNRQMVREPSNGCIRFEAGLDQDGGSAFLVDFPIVEDALPTTLGRVTATVSVEGRPEGSYDPSTGHIALDVPLLFEPKHMLARRSRVRVHLETGLAIAQPELTVDGSPLSITNGSLVMAGSGTFEGGSLDGGTLWLGVECTIDQLVIEEA